MNERFNASTKFCCNYKEYLNLFLPNIFPLLKFEPNWDKINSQINDDHQKRILKWDEEHAHSNVNQPKFLYIYDYPLYYVFHFALTGRPDALILLDFFNILFGELSKTIRPDSIHFVTPHPYKISKNN